MNRREVLAAAGTVAAAAFVAPAMAADHDHHHDHGVAAKAGLTASALDCVATGNACVAHCLDSFIAGDTSLAICAKTAEDVVAVCAALAKLAVGKSPHLAAYTKVAILVCRDCEKECRKHADKHPTCKACAESCAACAEECAKAA